MVTNLPFIGRGEKGVEPSAHIAEFTVIRIVALRNTDRRGRGESTPQLFYNVGYNRVFYNVGANAPFKRTVEKGVGHMYYRFCPSWNPRLVCNLLEKYWDSSV